MPLGVRIGAIMPALCSDVAIMPTQFFGCDYAEIMPGIRGWTQVATEIVRVLAFPVDKIQKSKKFIRTALFPTTTRINQGNGATLGSTQDSVYGRTDTKQRAQSSFS